jgi:hypothetical protein
MPAVGAISMAQVAAWRMRRQYLADDHPATDAVAVADRLCGVQAQVASSAELAVAVRTGRPAGPELATALAVATGGGDGGTDGAATLVRMWSVRGTLHLLTARGAALQCAVLGAQRTWDRPVWMRAFGIGREEVEALLAAVAELLPGRALTREELAAELTERVGPHLAEVLRSGWGTLLKPAATAGLLCHGPSRQGRVTFTSPATALRGWTPADPATAGPALVRDYLGTYGPATRDDFRNWLGRAVGARPIRAWFTELTDSGHLVEVEVDGVPGSFLTAEHVDELRETRPATGVRLLGGFDQYVIAVSRSIIPAAHLARVSRTAGWISPVLLHEGRIAGVWNLDGDRLVTDLFEKVPTAAITAERTRLATLLGRPLRR